MFGVSNKSPYICSLNKTDIDMENLIDRYEQRVKNLLNEFDMSSGSKKTQISIKLNCTRTILSELSKLQN